MKIMRFAIILIWFFLLSFAGCKKEPTQLEAERTEVSIGAVLPLTGPVASYGKNAKSGIDMALEEINAEGKIKITVIYEDDEGKVQNAVTAAQKLISTNKVPLIIGEAASGHSMAIAPICNKNKAVLFSPISSAAELTEKGGDFFFRVCPSDVFQARILAKWLLDDGKKKISLLFINNSWGASLKTEFISHYEQGGGIILTIEACKEGDRDFKSQLAKMAKAKTQAFVVFTYGKEGGPFLRQARELDIRVPVYGGDVWGSPELLEVAGEAAEGVFFTFPASPSGQLYDSFAYEYKKKYNKEPDIYAAYAYDLTHILAKALKNGANTGEQIKKYLDSMEMFEGVTGKTKFDKNGDVVTKTFDRKVIKGGKYFLVEEGR